MFKSFSKCLEKSVKIFNPFTQLRSISAKEISTALRQFYFSVHPDLFGKYPHQRATNENSLKQLSSYIEKVQSQKHFQPCTLHFYIRDSKDTGKFQLIKISLIEKNIQNTIKNILKSCNLSTEYVETLKSPPNPKPKIQFQHTYPDEYDINNMVGIKEKIHKAKEVITLRNWLVKNYDIAIEKYKSNELLRKDINNICEQIYDTLHIRDIRWDCGWNVMHFRGCLKSFIALARDHPEHLLVLKNRILVFAPFTGVSLDGHVMLNSGEVRHNWLDFIKNIRKHDDALTRIPRFEKAVSQVLRDIQVVRRKFMPKIVAEDYEKHLRMLMTTLNDYCGFKGYPKHWPTSLSNYKLVVETEAGPLMVSPTGQFIVPCSCPGFLLVNFISDNLNLAAKKMLEYNAHKNTEKILHALCIKELTLACFEKDDNITPELMIQCCENILEHKSQLKLLQNIHLRISTYYSVSSDGVVYIPWNFKI